MMIWWLGWFGDGVDDDDDDIQDSDNGDGGHVDDDIDEDNSEDEIDLFQQKFTCNYGSTGHLDWLLGTLHVPKPATWFHAMLPNVKNVNNS